MHRTRIWDFPSGSLEYPLVIAHRGGAGLAPENTLAAFRNAVAIGADGVELDARLSRDGQVVVVHDRRLDRTTTGTGPVGRYTVEELKRLDAGSWFGPQFKGERVLTLEEVFDVLPPNLLVNVDLKVRGLGAWTLATAVARVIRRCYRWDSTMVASFNPLSTAALRLFEPRITRGYTWSSKHVLPLRARWLAPLVRPLWLTPDRGTFTSEALSGFHEKGKLVLAWDLDTGTDMERLKEMRLDGVVTDHPDLLISSRTRRKLVDTET